jgi:hypothetical protein
MSVECHRSLPASAPAWSWARSTWTEGTADVLAMSFRAPISSGLETIPSPVWAGVREIFNGAPGDGVERSGNVRCVSSAVVGNVLSALSLLWGVVPSRWVPAPAWWSSYSSSWAAAAAESLTGVSCLAEPWTCKPHAGCLASAMDVSGHDLPVRALVHLTIGSPSMSRTGTIALERFPAIVT